MQVDEEELLSKKNGKNIFLQKRIYKIRWNSSSARASLLYQP